MLKLYFSFLFSAFCLFVLPTSAQKSKTDKQVYAFYNHNGKQMDFDEVVRELKKSDVVLFGEFHNNPLIHWLQIEITKALYETKGKDLILGAEMFEADDQLLIDEYLSGLITKDNFENEAKLWKNYSTDYAPLLLFAKENELPFIATNVPRRYASLVARAGLDTLTTLPKIAKSYIAPLPISFSVDIPGYSEMAEMMGGSHGGKAMNYIKAQAIKDATMAHFIESSRDKKQLFIHFNGDYHSANEGGIYWYLQNPDKKLEVKSIKVHENDSLQWEEELINSGDIILVVPENFNKSY